MSDSRYARVSARLRALPCGEGGQMLPIMAVIVFVLMGLGGLTIDAGHAVACQRVLQTSTDASALAAAQILPASSITGAPQSSDPIATANLYSSMTGGNNTSASLQSVSMASGYPKLECLSTLQTQGLACVTPVVGSGTGTAANAVQVVQQATVPLFFAGLFGFHSYTISAISTAAIRGGGARPANIAIIMDTTLSMDSVDTSCSNNTQMQCALNGVQVLLQTLSPCVYGQSNCSPTATSPVTTFDRVALFTFPNVSSTTVAKDTCTTTLPQPSSSNNYWYSTSNGFSTSFSIVMPYGPQSGNNALKTSVAAFSGRPTALAYSFPTADASSYTTVSSTTPQNTTATATYQITQFLSDYRVSDSSTSLNTSSTLVGAVGGSTGCVSMGPPSYAGVYGTYYAGAIYAAQSALVKEQSIFPGSQNIIILLSDGDANSPQSQCYNSNCTNSMSSSAGRSGTYPSYVNECQQAVTAANDATSQGTLFYTVAYGSPPRGCSTDTSSITPCQAMSQMASSYSMFYSDFNQSGSQSTCHASQSVSTLNSIFQAIAGTLTQPRLIPNTMT